MRSAHADTSPLYVYLQRPDTGEWVTVGRYLAPSDGRPGRFRYARSYADAGLSWSIDPVNLPFDPARDFEASRYEGLHDALRDACPDAWGQAVLSKAHGVPRDAPPSRFLRLSGNEDRWGALAVGTRKTPSVAHLNAPRLHTLDDLMDELAALAADQPAIRPQLRRRLVRTSSLGGARPKATVRDDENRYWLAKPRTPYDTADIPLLEHATRHWGAASGLSFVDTLPSDAHRVPVRHAAGSGERSPPSRSVVRVLRFDREGDRRVMCVSAATLLQAEYPGPRAGDDRWSYPRLSEELKRIGAPEADRIELFGRMVFNAICGNDDDHVRNHAVAWRQGEKRWRLSPAFDVVPNPDHTPTRLTMQLSLGRCDISREAVLADAVRFGFPDRDTAARHLDRLIERISHAYDAAAAHLGESPWREALRARLETNRRRLANPALLG